MFEANFFRDALNLKDNLLTQKVNQMSQNLGIHKLPAVND